MTNYITKPPHAQPEPQSILEWALYYAQLGFKIFPVVKGKKHPACKNGVKDATTDEEQIRRWFKHNDCNIGLATEGLLVIDLDFVKGSTKSKEDLLGDLKSVWQFYDDGTCCVQRTRSGGAHLIYRMPDDLDTVIKNATKIDRLGDVEVDLRKTGGYIVVAPSYVEADDKAKGGHYIWKCPLAAFDDLPYPPKQVCGKLVDIAQAKNTPKPPVAPSVVAPGTMPHYWQSLGEDDPVIIERASKYLAAISEAVSGQSGHVSLLKAATAMVQGFALSPNNAFHLLWNEYNSRCLPP